MVSITVNAGVVGVIEAIHDPVFNQRLDAVFVEFVAEGLRVVAAISSEAPQVVSVVSGDLRPIFPSCFLEVIGFVRISGN